MSELTVPHAVSWNLTQRCNLHCEHCYLDASGRSAPASEELSAAECMQIVDELAAMNPQLVLILTGGEPLLHPYLREIVERAARSGITPVLGTNGTAIQSRVALELRDAGLRGWGVSLDSTRSEDHDRLRGLPGAWQRSIEGLRVLRELELPFVIQPSIFSWNCGEVAALAGLALELGAVGVNFYFLVCTGRGQEVTDISAEGYEEALVEIARLQSEYAGRLMVNAKCAPHQKRVAHQRDAASPFVSGYDGGCPAATNYFRIGPDGLVSACPYIPSEGTSVRQRSIAQIWASDPQLLRLRDREALAGRCGRCEYREVCGGCRARALAQTGDALAEDPACRYWPTGGALARFEPERTFGDETRFSLAWSAEARRRLDRIPSFLASMVVARVESAAREAGLREVTPALMKKIRERGEQAGIPLGQLRGER